MSKKKEFEDLKDIKVKILENLQNMYISGINLTYARLDPFIQPYFETLLREGSIIKIQRKNQGINIFVGELYYEYHINHPKFFKEISMIGLLI